MVQYVPDLAGIYSYTENASSTSKTISSILVTLGIYLYLVYADLESVQYNLGIFLHTHTSKSGLV